VLIGKTCRTLGWKNSLRSVEKLSHPEIDEQLELLDAKLDRYDSARVDLAFYFHLDAVIFLHGVYLGGES